MNPPIESPIRGRRALDGDGLRFHQRSWQQRRPRQYAAPIIRTIVTSRRVKENQILRPTTHCSHVASCLRHKAESSLRNVRAQSNRRYDGCLLTCFADHAARGHEWSRQTSSSLIFFGCCQNKKQSPRYITRGFVYA